MTCGTNSIQGQQCIVVYNLCIILNVLTFYTHGLVFHTGYLPCNF